MIASSVGATRSRGRAIVQLTAGRTHGAITRLMSPGDLGELVKPFVFLDYFEAPSSGGPQMARSSPLRHRDPHDAAQGERRLSGPRPESRGSCAREASSGCRQAAECGTEAICDRASPFEATSCGSRCPRPSSRSPRSSQYLDPEAIESDGRVRVPPCSAATASLRSPIADVSRLSRTSATVRGCRTGEAWRLPAGRGCNASLGFAVNDGKLHVAGTVVSRDGWRCSRGRRRRCAGGPRRGADGVRRRLRGQASAPARVRLLLGGTRASRRSPSGKRESGSRSRPPCEPKQGNGCVLRRSRT